MSDTAAWAVSLLLWGLIWFVILLLAPIIYILYLVLELREKLRKAREEESAPKIEPEDIES